MFLSCAGFLFFRQEEHFCSGFRTTELKTTPTRKWEFSTHYFQQSLNHLLLLHNISVSQQLLYLNCVSSNGISVILCSQHRINPLSGTSILLLPPSHFPPSLPLSFVSFLLLEIFGNLLRREYFHIALF